jgi:nucleoside-diphosphate-sugar epimerase
MNFYNKILQNDLREIYESRKDWSMFINSTILITGANGFLPAYLVYFFQHLNYTNPNYNIKVIGLVRNEQKAKICFENIDDKFFKLHVQDVSLPLTITDKVDYIIHAASQASPKYYGIDPVGTLNANVLGTINLLEFAKKNTIKSFLYFSSGEVYGQLSEDQIPINENSYGYLDPTNVRSCYAESKRMGENICISYKHQYNIPAKIVRPFHTYGPGMLLDDGRVFADFVSNIVKNQDIVLKSDGEASRAFCYLSDATEGFLRVMLNGENGEAYNIGNPYEQYKIIELAEIMINLYPNKKLKIIFENKTTTTKYLKSPLTSSSPDIKKANSINWKPSVSEIEGFKRTVESFF